MLACCKKFFSILFVLFLFFSSGFAKTPVREYVLENGMHVFVLEDYSSALVRVEFASKAGFSNQNPNDAGFFPLYTRMFRYSTLNDTETLENLYSECFADSSRYIISVTNYQLENVLKALSDAAFRPVFLDSDLSRELRKLKKEVTENAKSIEGFINSSIDSRVFSKSPWKHDSGIYPSLFTKKTVSEARAILNSINSTYYVPDNCALFISGPVDFDSLIKRVDYYFGNSAEPKKKNIKKEVIFEGDFQKKLFVLSDPEFSPDMTQIVMQYTNLSMEDCDLAAAVFDRSDSVLKQKLLSNQELKIISAEYINAASTHKNGSSRLIIQSLMGKSKKSPYHAVLDFVNAARKSMSEFTEDDFNLAKENLSYQFLNSIDSSAHLINFLSEYWAYKDFSSDYENLKQTSLYESFMERPQRIGRQNYSELLDSLCAEDPFVFVLINSKVLEKYEKSFKASGYEIVTVKNGSWYTQKLYENIKNQEYTEIKPEESENDLHENLSTDLFVEKNKNSIIKFNLKNNIPVIIKEKKPSNTVCICFDLAGGEINRARTEYGLENVLIDCLYMNFDKSVYNKYIQGKLRYYPIIKCSVDLTSSCISIECLASDFDEVIDAFYEALVFNEIVPAMADSSIMNRKTEQIVKTGMHDYQLYSSAVNTLFNNKEIISAYNLNKDVYKKINFSRIVEVYPELLNANKFKVIISGNTSECYAVESIKCIEERLNSTLGNLAEKEKYPALTFGLNSIDKYIKKIKINHVFLTDVSREKAGPRPEVLIPTTEFLDPAQYWIFNDSKKRNTAQFNAILYDFAEQLQNKFREKETTEKIIVKVEPSTYEIPFGVITFTNVRRVFDVEDAYAACLKEFSEYLNGENARHSKDVWIKTYLEPTLSNLGTCMLIRKCLKSEDADPEQYIEDYKAVSELDEDEIRTILELFEINSVFKIYSADTK